MKRKVNDRTYLNYLLYSLNVDDLKEICRDFNIKGFSKLKKSELINFILDSLAEEEIKELINQKELEVISEGIDLALKKINYEDRENIVEIRIVNPVEHEVEILFKGWNWDTTSFLSIRSENIDDPERDCDCRIGAAMGFCSHFWVGFIFSLKQEFFKLKDWNLTILPPDFEEKVKNIVLSTQPGLEKEGGVPKSVTLIDESSEDFLINEFLDKSITVYEGKISNLEKKEQDFQGNITVYYIITLKDVKFGPKIQRKSDFKEENLRLVESLNLRLSEKLYSENELEKGNRVSASGKLSKDNFLKLYIVKNIRKIEKL
jgi:hypothetical protein